MRRYINNYAEVTRPLYKLVDTKDVHASLRKKNGVPNGKKVIVEWNEIAQACFYQLRDILCGELVLSLPNFELPFILTTDASDNGYGAILEQENEKGERKVIAYYSKSYTRAQKKYGTSEQELLAIVMAVEHFHTYLYGGKVKIFTDHAPLTHLANKKNPHPRMERWMLRLECYQLEFKHKPGKDNIAADMLSRLPDENAINSDSQDDYFDKVIAQIGQDSEHTISDETQTESEVLLQASNSEMKKRTEEDLAKKQDQDEDIK